MIAQKETSNVKTPRGVQRGVNSQNSNSEVGIHWLRISIPHKYLKQVRLYCDRYFGESSQDGRGLWAYDTRYTWSNGAALYFDDDPERAEQVHGGRATLELCGRVLDGIAQDRLHCFVIGFQPYAPNCTRCDVFFDDYRRTIEPDALKTIAKKKNFSRFNKFQIKQHYEPIPGKNATKLVHDEIDFGSRGENGCGKYLRVYDKTLESDGKKDCVRWEIEFSKERSHKVFEKLCQVTSIESFAALCGSLIAGAIVFVHRSSEKNIGRLVIYNFWRQIKKLLGCVVIRIEKKFSDIGTMHKFIWKQVTPTLATLRRTFQTDSDFLVWLFDVVDDGELRMTQRQINIAKSNKRRIRYRDGKVFDEEDVLVA